MPKQLTTIVLHPGITRRTAVAPRWPATYACDEPIEYSADNTKDIYIMHAGIDIHVHHVTLCTIMLCALINVISWSVP